MRKLIIFIMFLFLTGCQGIVVKEGSTEAGEVSLTNENREAESDSLLEDFNLIDPLEEVVINENKFGIENAIQKGTSVTAEFEEQEGFGVENVSIEVLEVIRGEDAFNKLQAELENTIWELAPLEDSNQEYLIVKASFTLNKVKDVTDSRQFYVADSSGETYSNIAKQNWFDASQDKEFKHLSEQVVEAGETITGYEVFIVDKSDSQPLLTYRNMLVDNSDGLWLKLY